MNKKAVFNKELETLSSAVDLWCDFLSKNNYDNFSIIFRLALEKLNGAFAAGDKEKYEALLRFQDHFRGAMGSINDLPFDDVDLRKRVESQRDLLIDKYFALTIAKK